jgi:hypothetical protein
MRECPEGDGMKRKLVTILAALSLLLCLAAIVLWGRSYSRYDRIRWNGESSDSTYVTSRTILFLSGGGGVSFSMLTGQVLQSHLQAVGELREIWKWHPQGFEFETEKAEITVYPFALANPPPSVFRMIGFEFGNQHHLSGSGKEQDVVTSNRWFVVPWWCVISVFAVMPLIAAFSFYRRSRLVRDDHCPNCNYDLRATPERCPECGNVPKATA